MTIIEKKGTLSLRMSVVVGRHWVKSWVIILSWICYNNNGLLWMVLLLF